MESFTLMSVLAIKNLFLKLNQQEILRNISLDIALGEIYCILGKNGSGKSSLFKTILGLYSFEGDILVCQKDISHTSRKNFMPHLGALVENAALYEHLTAYENLQIIARYYKNVSSKRIEEVLEIIGLQQESKKQVKHFSQGMKQRLGIGIAILHQPALVLLDEPTNTLDPEATSQLRNLIFSLNRNQKISFLINTHHLEEAEKIADKILIMKEGRIICRNEEINQMKLVSGNLVSKEMKKLALGFFQKNENFYYLYKNENNFSEFTKPTLEEVFLALHQAVI